MKSVRKVAVFVAAISTSVGVAAALPTTASAAALPQPYIHLQGHRVERVPGKMIGHAYAGSKGHLGCQVFYYTQDHPALTKVTLPKPLSKDNAQVHFKLHNLDLTKTYYFDLQCGKPLRTIASDSAFPDQAYKKPYIIAQGNKVYKATAFGPDAIRVVLNARHYGHLGCAVYEHEAGNPKLIHVYAHRIIIDRDNEESNFYRHNLNPDKRYTYTIRCGKNNRIVGTDSDIPTQPIS